jgi:hypothetical protein
MSSPRILVVFDSMRDINATQVIIIVVGSDSTQELSVTNTRRFPQGITHIHKFNHCIMQHTYEVHRRRSSKHTIKKEPHGTILAGTGLAFRLGV